jgi:hypothetical protein
LDRHFLCACLHFIDEARLFRFDVEPFRCRGCAELNIRTGKDERFCGEFTVGDGSSKMSRVGPAQRVASMQGIDATNKAIITGDACEGKPVTAEGSFCDVEVYGWYGCAP